MHRLIQASDFSGSVEFARISVLRALNRHVEPVFSTPPAKAFRLMFLLRSMSERQDSTSERPAYSRDR
jgi:hypothetical protein